MALDAWREGNEFVVAVDLPGVETESIDVDVEQNVLSIRAERKDAAADGVEYVFAQDQLPAKDTAGRSAA